MKVKIINGAKHMWYEDSINKTFDIIGCSTDYEAWRTISDQLIYWRDCDIDLDLVSENDRLNLINIKSVYERENGHIEACRNYALELDMMLIMNAPPATDVNLHSNDRLDYEKPFINPSPEYLDHLEYLAAKSITETAIKNTMEYFDPHYNNSKGSIYKFAKDHELNAWEFDIVKRISRCRKKGQFKSDLEKTKRVIDLYMREYESMD